MHRAEPFCLVWSFWKLPFVITGYFYTMANKSSCFMSQWNKKCRDVRRQFGPVGRLFMVPMMHLQSRLINFMTYWNRKRLTETWDNRFTFAYWRWKYPRLRPSSVMSSWPEAPSGHASFLPHSGSNWSETCLVPNLTCLMTQQKTHRPLPTPHSPDLRTAVAEHRDVDGSTMNWKQSNCGAARDSGSVGMMGGCVVGAGLRQMGGPISAGGSWGVWWYLAEAPPHMGGTMRPAMAERHDRVTILTATKRHLQQLVLSSFSLKMSENGRHIVLEGVRYDVSVSRSRSAEADLPPERL